jgi:group I intron endonuclease
LVVSDEKYCVYWIRLKEHTDITTQGYVGVSFDFFKRMERHKRITSKLQYHLSNAIKKYGWDNLIKEIVFTGAKEECYKKETQLREKANIGWNEAKGGFGGDRSNFINYTTRNHTGWSYNKKGTNNPFYSKKHSKESRNKISKTKSKTIIKTPEGVFYGFNEVARFYNINKITAKKWTIKKEDWCYENI